MHARFAAPEEGSRIAGGQKHENRQLLKAETVKFGPEESKLLKQRK